MVGNGWRQLWTGRPGQSGRRPWRWWRRRRPGWPEHARVAAAAQPSACMGQAAQAPVLHARMLSPRQYNNTVEDLLKVAGNPARDFGGGADTQLDDLGVERRANAAAGDRPPGGRAAGDVVALRRHGAATASSRSSTPSGCAPSATRCRRSSASS